MLCDTKELTENVILCLKAKLVPMITGQPGIGKSAIIYQIAEEYKLELIDIRLSQCDPTELNGFPAIQNGVASYVPMSIFPLEKTLIPKGKNGFLIFLDEFNSAPLSTQAASYKLILDKTVGQYKLHPKAVIVCAGNTATDNAIVNRLSTAMQSRLIHLELHTDIDEWIKWANLKNIDHRVISYVHGRPDNLHKFDPNHHDKTFASPRTWEFVSKLIKNYTGSLTKLLPLIAGTISEAVAREFIIYSEIYTKLPTINEIVKNPLKAPLEQEPAMLYAIAHMIAAHANKNNIQALMLYIERMPIEFETITLQGIIQKDKTMLEEDCIKIWITTKSTELF